MIETKKIFVQSSNIWWVEYNVDKLIVKFHNGMMYVYFNVPYYIFTSLLSSDSKGKFLNLYIKNHYAYQRIG